MYDLPYEVEMAVLAWMTVMNKHLPEIANIDASIEYDRSISIVFPHEEKIYCEYPSFKAAQVIWDKLQEVLENNAKILKEDK